LFTARLQAIRFSLGLHYWYLTVFFSDSFPYVGSKNEVKLKLEDAYDF